ncbi:MAG: DUF294 nucleotidyltransferase-like domain-containing protein [Candidatus Auribacterota bacterium]|nr:DUF294 nucleotidyltransferase-like domain-containing protein [Candidatus Auribacterota bacterium]
MKKLKFLTDEDLDKALLQRLADDFFRQYEYLFEKTSSSIRMSFLKMITRKCQQEYQELIELNMRYDAWFRKIHACKSITDLASIHQTLNNISADIFLNTKSVMDVHQRCTFYRDKLTLKVLSLTKSEMEKSTARPENAFAWIRMGSTGRDEQTLVTDQDNLLVYKNKKDKSYYQEFAARAVNNLESIGFNRCKGKIMPTNDKWFGTLSEWRAKLHTYIVDSENLVDLIVLTDAKYAGGNYPLAQAFISEARKVLKMYHASFKAIAKATVLMPIALTIFRNFKTEKKGEYKDMLNIKFQAWLPLIMITLLFSLENDVWETNTMKRIKALEDMKLFEPYFTDELLESYIILTYLKIVLQIDYMRGNSTNLTYFINPYTLDKKNRSDLKRALSTVEKFQRLASSSYNISEDAL